MRPSKIDTAMAMAHLVKARSTCHRPSVGDGVGCVITTTDGFVLTTGYNGSVRGAPHCNDEGHQLVNGHCVRAVHAEANAVGQAANRGVSLKGAMAFVTVHPCVECTKLLHTAGVTKVFYDRPYMPERDEAVRAIVPSLLFQRWSPALYRANDPAKGLLVVLEGIDGTGKTTIVRTLAHVLGMAPVYEPGGTEYANRIRAGMVGLETRPGRLSMIHSFAAARADLHDVVVRRAMDDGVDVLSDRSFVSSMVFQSETKDEMKHVLSVNASVLDEYRTWPDLIVLLDMSAGFVPSRTQSSTKDNPGGFDTDSFKVHESRRERYREAIAMVKHESDGQVIIIDASRPFEAVLDDVHAVVLEARLIRGVLRQHATTSAVGQ